MSDIVQMNSQNCTRIELLLEHLPPDGNKSSARACAFLLLIFKIKLKLKFKNKFIEFP